MTNKSSFPVHNVDGLDKDYADIWQYDDSKTTAPTFNRFHDTTPDTELGEDQTPIFRRVYWGKDPNYDQNITDVSQYFNLAKAENLDNEDASKFETHDYGDEVSNPKYCLENTFDIAHMTQDQTTRVLFKAIYLHGQKATDPDKVTTGTTFYKIGDQSGLYNEDDLKTLINNIVKNVTGKTEGTDYTLDLGKIGTEAGPHELSVDNFKNASGTNLTEEEIKNVNAKLNGKIKTYLNGVCYYIGRIKHFGNEETPWKQGDPTYGGKNLEYLGRYGVLRNNWYSLKVNSVSGPGEPVIPDTPDIPDDDNNFINLSVKVLKWAKRGQVLHF